MNHSEGQINLVYDFLNLAFTLLENFWVKHNLIMWVTKVDLKHVKSMRINLKKKKAGKFSKLRKAKLFFNMIINSFKQPNIIKCQCDAEYKDRIS